MDLKVNLNKKIPLEEVRNVIISAMETDKRIAEYKKAKYMNICEKFEIEYGMDSNIFMEKFDAGQLDDRDDFFDWYAAKRSLDIWMKRLEILTGISL